MNMAQLGEMDVDIILHVPSPNYTYLKLKIPTGSSHDNTTHNYKLVITKVATGDVHEEEIETNNDEILSKFCLESRSRYEYILYKMDIENKQTTHYQTASFTVYNSQADVDELMDCAEEYIELGSNLNEMEITRLYRNKPSDHPTIVDALANIPGEDHVMRKYIKDQNGDPASSINGNVEGLFFFVTPNEDGSIPNNTPFGDFQITVPPHSLLKGCNLYFADFTCLGGRKSHWVTLVGAKVGSAADDYCKNRLIKLNLENNSFFVYNDGKWIARTMWSFRIELFYTEDINLDRTPGLEWNLGKGYGGSDPAGIPKTPDCPKCKLRPIN